MLLLICLVLQGVAVADCETLGAGGQLAHGALHWQATSHHHHDDGATHLDEQSELIEHTHADQGPGWALTVGAAGSLGAMRPPTPMAPQESHAQQPVLEGPLRPPRFADTTPLVA